MLSYSQVLRATLVCLSGQMLKTTDEVTLLHQLASYHVAYHLNEVHFIQYRALGSIFLDLHGLVADHFSHQSEGTAQGQSSTDIAEACYTRTLSSLQLHTECILRCEILLTQSFPFCSPWMYLLCDCC